MRPTIRRWLIPLAALVVLLGAGMWRAARGAEPAVATPRVLVLIDPATRAGLGAALDAYRQDAVRSLAPRYGTAISVEVQEIDLASYFPGGVRDEAAQNRLTADVALLLERAYREQGLIGIVLVGPIALPRAYDEGAARLTLYPWVDFDRPAFAFRPSAGRFERTAEKDPRPELWSGVIRAPGDGGIAELRAYFERNHRAHAGQPAIERRALVNDIWGEDEMRDIRLPDGRVPTKDELPGGSELARRAAAARIGQRLASTGRYDGVNFADDFLPKGKDDQSKTVAELLQKADARAKDAWRNSAGIKRVDVASQVILYFDRWTEFERDRLNRARTEAAAVVGGARPGFDLFARGGYDFCADRGPADGNGYFSLPPELRAAVARRSGFRDQEEFELVLRWSRIYTDAEKRLHLVRDGVPPFGKYRGTQGSYEIRLTVAPGEDGYELHGAKLEGRCLQNGSRPASGGAIEILLGAATAKESSAAAPESLALWATARGPVQAAYGNIMGPPKDLVLPDDLLQLDRAQIAELAARADAPGFGRSASARGMADGVGFERDPFLLGILSGQPVGEALRQTLDETSVLYGDPTFRLR